MNTFEFMMMIYKILPFILVSYFIISSFLGNDFSGFLVFLGILMSSFVTSILSNIPPINKMIQKEIGADDKTLTDKINKYKILKFGEGNSVFPLVPLGTNTFCFILGYFIMVISMTTGNAFASNWLLLTVLSLVIGFDIYVNYSYIGIFILFPVILGFVMGILWAVIIGKTNHMVPKKQTSTCAMSSSKNYTCKLSKNGSLL
jgi:hypothetical protein